MQLGIVPAANATAYLGRLQHGRPWVPHKNVGAPCEAQNQQTSATHTESKRKKMKKSTKQKNTERKKETERIKEVKVIDKGDKT